ncbi:MAG: ABC transporter substrate-binding protein [Bacillota bacterium]
MRKVIVILILLLLVLGTVFNSAEAKEKKRILMLDSQTIEPYKSLREEMFAELSKLGYKKENNLLIDYEVLGNFKGRGYNILKFKKLANYDVIVLNGTVAGMAAVQFMKEEQVDSKKPKFVFASVTDPVGVGMVEKLGVPSTTNFTGVAFPVPVAERLGLIQQVFGENLKIGFIYADMPQSRSYNSWLRAELKKEEFAGLDFIFREVDFIRSNNGTKRMVEIAKKHVKELDDKVDIFVSASDQIGSSAQFSQMVYQTASKPLVGISREEGVTLSLATDQKKNGKKVAQMIVRILEGAEIKEIIPQKSESTVYFDWKKIKEFGIQVPDKLKKE